MSSETSPKILVIRRDNIGDLVCTTPLISALRQRFPNAWIGALVNSYNAPVLDGNDDLDEVFIYTKAKHRAAGESLVGIFWRRWRMMRRLRKLGLDDIIVATTSPQPRVVEQARWLRPKRVIGYGDVAGLDVALPVAQEPLHEVEDVFRVARLYGIEGPPPACRVMRPADISAEPTRGAPPGTLTIGVHISARKPSQRWPAEYFAELMCRLAAQRPVRFVLLWSPGSDDNPLHPGDDAKARAVIEKVGASSLCVPGIPLRGQVTVIAQPTHELGQLIGALAGCQALICADGGAMHLAAGLGLPIVSLFGNSGTTRWRPWGVPYRLLQDASLDVSNISVDAVVAAFDSLGVSAGG